MQFFHMLQTLQTLYFLQKQVLLMGSMQFWCGVVFACVLGCLEQGGGGHGMKMRPLVTAMPLDQVVLCKKKGVGQLS